MRDYTNKSEPESSGMMTYYSAVWDWPHAAIMQDDWLHICFCWTAQPALVVAQLAGALACAPLQSTQFGSCPAFLDGSALSGLIVL